MGELVQFSKGTGYSKGDLKESGTPIILYGRLYTKYETVISNVDTFADAKVGSVYSCGGEVIVPASGETAEDISVASVVEKSGVLLGGDLNIITPSADLDSAFLAISISNGKPHEDMAKMAQGKSVVHLHNTDLEKIDLAYPSHEEQTQISGFFRGFDDLITLHQRKPFPKIIGISMEIYFFLFVTHGGDTFFAFLEVVFTRYCASYAGEPQHIDFLAQICVTPVGDRFFCSNRVSLRHRNTVKSCIDRSPMAQHSLPV